MRTVLASLTFLTVQTVFAASGGEHSDHHIPWMELVIPQIVNVTALVVGLIILLKKPVREYFKNQYQEFQEALKNAQKARSEAEVRHQEVKRKIAEIEASSETNLQEAKTNAAALKEKIVSDARSAAEKITSEAERMAGFELTRAMSALRMEVISHSMAFAEKELKTKMQKPVQERLNDEFVEKIRTVGR